MTVDVNGNFGIGTTSPTSRLTISGPAAVPNAGTGGLGGDSTYGLQLIGYGSIGDVSLYNRSGTIAAYVPTNTTNFNVVGNVGIGNTDPQEKLDVSGTASTTNLEVHSNVTFTSITNGLLQVDGSGVVSASTTLSSSFIEDVFLRNDADDTTTGQLTAANFVASNASATSTFAGGLNVDSGGLVYNLSTNRVGIGTVSPQSPLHVSGADSGATVNATADEIIAESSGNAGISVLSGATSRGSLFFGDSGNPLAGFLQYNHDGDYFRVGTVGVERVRVDSTGLVGIGTTSPAYLLDVDGDFRVGEAGSSNALFVDATNGRVGVGTASPGELLHLSGATDATLRIEATNASANSMIDFYEGGVEAMRIQHDGTNDALVFWDIAGTDVERMVLQRETGNLGIGNTDPQEKLDVSGTASTTNLEVHSNVTFTSITSGLLQVDGSGVVSASTTLSSSFMEDAYVLNTGDTMTGTLVLPNAGLQVGSSVPFSDSSGTLTLQNIDALDATTESTIEAAIDTLANLTAASSLATVGTLNSGAISSGFGNIDIGSSNLDADGTITFGGLANGGFLTTDASGVLSTTTVSAGDLALTNGYVFRGSSSNVAEATSSLFIADDGDVGIGNQSPNALLTVDDGGGNPVLSFYTADATYALSRSGTQMILDSSGNTSVQANGIVSLNTGASRAQRLIVDASGNVGIGDTGPDALLDISSSTASTLFRVDDSGDGDTSPFIIDGDGNVGIGTSTPSSLLSVQGDLRVGAAGGDTFFVDNTSRYVGIRTTSPAVPLAVSGDTRINGNLVLSANGLGAANLATISHDNQNLTLSTTNGTGHILLSPTGNVGIGTTSPSNALHVESSGANATGLLVTGGSTYQSNAASGEIRLGDLTDHGLISYAGSDGDLVFSNSFDATLGDIKFRTRTNGTPVEALTITGAGNIGIGTTSPSEKLDIYDGNLRFSPASTVFHRQSDWGISIWFSPNSHYKKCSDCGCSRKQRKH